MRDTTSGARVLRPTAVRHVMSLLRALLACALLALVLSGRTARADVVLLEGPHDPRIAWQELNAYARAQGMYEKYAQRNAEWMANLPGARDSLYFGALDPDMRVRRGLIHVRAPGLGQLTERTSLSPAYAELSHTFIHKPNLSSPGLRAFVSEVLDLMGEPRFRRYFPLSVRPRLFHAATSWWFEQAPRFGFVPGANAMGGPQWVLAAPQYIGTDVSSLEAIRAAVFENHEILVYPGLAPEELEALGRVTATRGLTGEVVHQARHLTPEMADLWHEQRVAAFLAQDATRRAFVEAAVGGEKPSLRRFLELKRSVIALDRLGRVVRVAR